MSEGPRVRPEVEDVEDAEDHPRALRDHEAPGRANPDMTVVAL